MLNMCCSSYRVSLTCLCAWSPGSFPKRANNAPNAEQIGWSNGVVELGVCELVQNLFWLDGSTHVEIQECEGPNFHRITSHQSRRVDKGFCPFTILDLHDPIHAYDCIPNIIFLPSWNAVYCKIGHPPRQNMARRDEVYPDCSPETRGRATGGAHVRDQLGPALESKDLLFPLRLPFTPRSFQQIKANCWKVQEVGWLQALRIQGLLRDPR